MVPPPSSPQHAHQGLSQAGLLRPPISLSVRACRACATKTAHLHKEVQEADDACHSLGHRVVQVLPALLAALEQGAQVGLRGP